MKNLFVVEKMRIIDGLVLNYESHPACIDITKQPLSDSIQNVADNKATDDVKETTDPTEDAEKTDGDADDKAQQKRKVMDDEDPELNKKIAEFVRPVKYKVNISTSKRISNSSSTLCNGNCVRIPCEFRYN